MATANQMRAAARDAMRDGAVVITAADFSDDGLIRKVQLYFFDENEAVMDYVEKVLKMELQSFFAYPIARKSKIRIDLLFSAAGILLKHLLKLWSRFKRLHNRLQMLLGSKIRLCLSR